MGQGGTLAGDTQTLSHRVGSLDSWPHQSSSWRPAGNLTPALQSSLAEAALHTSILTHSSHLLTAEPSPNIQSSCSTDTLGSSTPDMLDLDYIHTQTDTPTHKAPDYMQGTGRAIHQPCALGELSSESQAGSQGRS